MNDVFRMRVKDVFRFEDGSTVLAGDVSGGPDFLPAGYYELSVGDDVFGEIKFDGERSRGRVSGLRSIGLSRGVKLHGLDLTGRDAVLRSARSARNRVKLDENKRASEKDPAVEIQLLKTELARLTVSDNPSVRHWRFRLRSLYERLARLERLLTARKGFRFPRPGANERIRPNRSLNAFRKRAKPRKQDSPT